MDMTELQTDLQSRLSLSERLSDRLCAALKAVDRIEKRGHNDKFNYDFATESDIAEGVRAALADQGIALQVAVVSVEMRELGKTSSGSVMWLTTAKMELSLRAGDECWTSTFYGTGTDTGDKGLYKAITGGVKYFLLKTLLIPTGDDPEREQETVKPAAPRQAAAPNSAPKPPPAPASTTDTGEVFSVVKVYDSKKPYGVVFSDDVKATTFDDAVRDQAKDAAELGYEVRRQLTTKEKDGRTFTNLIALWPVESSPPPDDDPTPF